MNKKIIFILPFFILLSIHAQNQMHEIDELIQKYVENEQFSGSVLIADKEQIVLSKGYGLANMEWRIPNTADTKFRIASITKQFTTVLVMKHLEQGLISLDATISDYIPFYNDTLGHQIKIRHLLTHTSGLPNYTNFKPEKDVYPREEFITNFCMNPTLFKPGTRYSYSNTGYYLLGDILERISGRTIEELLNEYIFIPAGMHDSGVDNGYKVIPNKANSYTANLKGYNNADQMSSENMASNVFTAGYIYSTINDLYKFYMALDNDLLINAATKKSLYKIVAPLTSAEKMKTNNPLLFEVLGTSYIGQMGDIFIKINPKTNDSTICYQHNGGINMYRSHAYFIPSKGRILVILGNNGSDKGDEIIWQSLRILDGAEATYPKKSLIALMRNSFKDGGIEMLLNNFRLYSSDPAYDVSERALNTFAYNMVRENYLDESVRMFELIAQKYPLSYNAWDSYAEIMLRSKDTINAVKLYKKSLELNPNSRSGRTALENLGEEY